MTMTTITRRTELAHRRSEGIDFCLFWSEPTSRVTVGLLDARTGDGFELEVNGRHALDVVNHRYAYAARTKWTRRSVAGPLIAQAASRSGAAACRRSATLIAE